MLFEAMQPGYQVIRVTKLKALEVEQFFFFAAGLCDSPGRHDSHVALRVRDFLRIPSP